MTPAPITKVYDESGELIHDCDELGCDASWDGYSRETGEPLEGRTEPGAQWDTSEPGIARARAAAQ